MNSGGTSGRYLYVRRRTDAGTVVCDVIWTGGGKGDRFFPRHMATASSCVEAELIVRSLTEQEDRRLGA